MPLNVILYISNCNTILFVQLKIHYISNCYKIRRAFLNERCFLGQGLQYQSRRNEEAFIWVNLFESHFNGLWSQWVQSAIKGQWFSLNSLNWMQFLILLTIIQRRENSNNIETNIIIITGKMSVTKSETETYRTKITKTELLKMRKYPIWGIIFALLFT